MTPQQIELLDSIRGLARAVYQETGKYTSYEEHMHTTDALGVGVTIQTADWDFMSFRGSNRPVQGYETTIEQMRDDLADWLAQARKEEAA